MATVRNARNIRVIKVAAIRSRITPAAAKVAMPNESANTISEEWLGIDAMNIR